MSHVVDKDVAGTSAAYTIADGVRRKRKEPDFILINEKEKEIPYNSTGCTNSDVTSLDISKSKKINKSGDVKKIPQPFPDTYILATSNCINYY